MVLHISNNQAPGNNSGYFASCVVFFFAPSAASGQRKSQNARMSQHIFRRLRTKPLNNVCIFRRKIARTGGESNDYSLDFHHR